MVTVLYIGSEGFQTPLYGLWKMKKKSKIWILYDYGQNVF